MRHSSKNSTYDAQIFHVHAPTTTIRTRVSIKNVPWGSDRAGGAADALARMFCKSPWTGEGVNLRCTP